MMFFLFEGIKLKAANACIVFAWVVHLSIFLHVWTCLVLGFQVIYSRFWMFVVLQSAAKDD